ncbi:MAG: putative secreted protein [Gammaproteobacteria bacterium]|jgi:uncharacterized protein (TIGR02246 family)|nr:putative secreted protein [Gammaproteobacteria bacterium]
MKKILTVFAVIISVLVTSMAYADSGKQESKAIKAAYRQWVEAVTTAKGKPEKVLALYAPDAVLLPTLKEGPFKTREELQKYFVGFTSLKKLSAKTNKISVKVSGNIGMASGIYTFSYIDSKGNPVSTKARFTFVYEKIDGKWLIIKHHSSASPESDEVDYDDDDD